MEAEFDLTACDREPIHIPGAVQPHGSLLVLDRETLRVEQAGGACKAFFGITAEVTLGKAVTELVSDTSNLALEDCDRQPAYAGSVRTPHGHELDAVAHVIREKLILELEPATPRRRPAAEMARIVEAAGTLFAAATSICDVCEAAAAHFRETTGFDGVMIYHFLPDETGSVIAEDKIGELPPFLNHRFPASDIPRQARELYLRNVIRSIPEVSYIPRPLIARDRANPPLDMSNCHLRSVSPIHVQYLKNMGVGASCSISITCNQALWGLVACHHRSAKHLPYDERVLCRLLCGAFSHRIASLEDAKTYKTRVSSLAAEDSLLRSLPRAEAVEAALNCHMPDMLSVVSAHGIAIRRGGLVTFAGVCPKTEDILALADWLLGRAGLVSFGTAGLASEYPPAAGFQEAGSGLLAVTISGTEPYQLLWFRAEQIEVINWAGNPHKAVDPGNTPGTLTPRKSFELWQETVRGRAEPWSVADVEAAERIALRVGQLQRNQLIGRLNHTLRDALMEREGLVAEKERLLREGDHRIKNSLQFVQSILWRQMRESRDPKVRTQLEGAINRVNAVVTVHERLYHSDQPQTIDLDTYVTELVSDITASLPPEWQGELRVHAMPVRAQAQVAMCLGLMVTETVTNAVKYAYDGRAGPIDIEVLEQGKVLRLAVRDQGRGVTAHPHEQGGLGTKLVSELAAAFQGTFERTDACPGLKVTVAIPITLPAADADGSGHPAK